MAPSPEQEAAVAAERARIAEALHREAVQAVSAAVLQLDLVRRAAQGTDVAEQLIPLEAAVHEAARSLRELLSELRAREI